MHHENGLEKRLSAWIPRRPSLRLERLLFGERADDMPLRPAPSWHWLAPVAGGLLACLAIGLQPIDGISDGLPPDGRAGEGHGRTVLWAGGDSQSHANSWGGQQFESTRLVGFTSSIASDVVLATNRMQR